MQWFYIQWNNNTHNNAKIQNVIMDMGWEAYGVYVAVMEIIHHNGGELPLDCIQSMAWTMHIPLDKLKTFLNRFYGEKLLYVSDNMLCSPCIDSQLKKKERAVSASKARWQDKSEPTPNACTLTEEQKKSSDFLVSEMKMTKEKADELALKYEYGYIKEKVDYTKESCRNHGIVNPHGYLMKALQDNWVSTKSILPETKSEALPTQSYGDVYFNKFISDYKSVTGTDYPHKEKLKEFMQTDEQYYPDTILDILNSHSADDRFWEETAVDPSEVMLGTLFFDREKIDRINAYENTVKSKSAESILRRIGVI